MLNEIDIINKTNMDKIVWKLSDGSNIPNYSNQFISYTSNNNLIFLFRMNPIDSLFMLFNSEIFIEEFYDPKYKISDKLGFELKEAIEQQAFRKVKF